MNQARVIDSNTRPAGGVCGDYDGWLLGAAGLIIALGLVMVASASMPIAHKNGYIELYYFWRQCAAVLLGLGCGVLITRIPLAVVERLSTFALLLSIVLLALTLVDGIGREVNGSTRWIPLGPISLQASEPVKLAVIIYISSYLVRHGSHVQAEFIGLIKPLGVLSVIAVLLLAEPNFGATAVIFATTLGLLFIGRVPIVRFIACGLVAVVALGVVATQSSYQMERLMTFMDPWSDPWNSGFQLTQALIAFGRGEWLGVGLGNSVQKLFYLPEVHTDFVFAVVAEELGFVGSLVVVGLFLFLVWRIFFIADLAQRRGQDFAAYLAYGVGLTIGIEAFINIGVNMGLLPTKGLPLPLMSYGSNSLVVMCVMLALVLRAAREARDYDGNKRGHA